MTRGMWCGGGDSRGVACLFDRKRLRRVTYNGGSIIVGSGSFQPVQFSLSIVGTRLTVIVQIQML